MNTYETAVENHKRALAMGLIARVCNEQEIWWVEYADPIRNEWMRV